MLVVETIARIRKDHLVRGVPIKKIARDLRVSKNTVRKVVRRAAGAPPRARSPGRRGQSAGRLARAVPGRYLSRGILTVTEYEAATLVVQEALLWATLAVGLGKIAVLYYGIRTMEKLAREADARQARAMQAEERRHMEVMAALHELIRRTAPAHDR